MQVPYLIIGSGVAGLAAAIRLRCKGHEVMVFERNSFVGGKLSSLQLGPYRFDAGPSLFTMPQYVDELFELAGRNPRQHFNYERLETVCHYFWEDGTRFQAPAKVEDFVQQAQKVLGADGQKLQNYLKKSRFQYESTEGLFLKRSLHRLKTYATKDFFRGLIALPRLGIFTTMNQMNQTYLQNDKLVQLFNRYATYNGSDPYQASAILNLIPHLEHQLGAYLPRGGMRAISQALYDLALDLGVVFQLNQSVEKIIVHQGQAQALQLANGQEIQGQGIVCNMDIFLAYRKLLADQEQPKKILEQEKSSSALIFYWGIKERLPELDVHNIFFAQDYQAEFRAIFTEKQLYPDPTVYVHLTSRHEAQDAPAQSDNWFVMINVPALQPNQDWDKLAEQAKVFILNKLKRLLNRPDLEQLIEVEGRLDPKSIEIRTQSHLGSLYGTSSNNRSAAFFRHPNFSRKIKNLYFCGGSVHPGGGIPLCLLSAKLATEDL